jgi:hypothetical protein
MTRANKSLLAIVIGGGIVGGILVVWLTTAYNGRPISLDRAQVYQQAYARTLRTTGRDATRADVLQITESLTNGTMKLTADISALGPMWRSAWRRCMVSDDAAAQSLKLGITLEFLCASEVLSLLPDASRQ